MMESACEVNGKNTREKNDGDEALEEGTSPPLHLDPNEIIEAVEETLPYEEEDWENPELIKVPKNIEPDLLFTIQTRQSDRTRTAKKYNTYGDEQKKPYEQELTNMRALEWQIETSVTIQDADRESLKWSGVGVGLTHTEKSLINIKNSKRNS